MAKGPRVNSNEVPGASSPPIDAQTRYFTSAWYRFLVSQVGPAAPSADISPTGSPDVFTASQRGFVCVQGGTVSSIVLTRGRAPLVLTLPVQFIPVSQGDTVTVTYSAAPTMTFLPS